MKRRAALAIFLSILLSMAAATESRAEAAVANSGTSAGADGDIEKVDEEKRIADATVALAWVTAALAFFTAGLFFVTYQLARDSRRVSERQAGEMQASLVNAAATTSALQDVAQATRRNTELLQPMLAKQMRAYVSVDFGQATYQDETWNFGSSPVLTNTGLTPARNVCFSVNADVLEMNLPTNFVFAAGEMNRNDATLHPRQTMVIHAGVPKRFELPEVANIMQGQKRRLFVWGVIKYEDVYGDKWETKFCQNFVFIPNPDNKGFRPLGYYHPTHNHST